MDLYVFGRGTPLPYIQNFSRFYSTKLYDKLIAAAAAVGFNEMPFKKTFYSLF